MLHTAGLLQACSCKGAQDLQADEVSTVLLRARQNMQEDWSPDQGHCLLILIWCAAVLHSNFWSLLLPFPKAALRQSHSTSSLHDCRPSSLTHAVQHKTHVSLSCFITVLKPSTLPLICSYHDWDAAPKVGFKARLQCCCRVIKDIDLAQRARHCTYPYYSSE